MWRSFQNPGSRGVLTGGGGVPLRIGHDAGLTESVKNLLRLLKLLPREWETANHVLADEMIHVVQAKVAQSGMPYLRRHNTETEDTGSETGVLQILDGKANPLIAAERIACLVALEWRVMYWLK
jgi:hypothetical protein